MIHRSLLTKIFASLALVLLAGHTEAYPYFRDPLCQCHWVPAWDWPWNWEEVCVCDDNARALRGTLPADAPARTLEYDYSPYYCDMGLFALLPWNWNKRCVHARALRDTAPVQAADAAGRNAEEAVVEEADAQAGDDAPARTLRYNYLTGTNCFPVWSLEWPFFQGWECSNTRA